MKILSKNNDLIQISLPLIVGALVVLMTAIALSNLGLVDWFGISVLIVAFFLWIYRRYQRQYNVFYNDTKLILRSQLEYRQISLKNIGLLKLNLSDARVLGIQYYSYNITFRNEIGEEEIVHIYVSNQNDDFLEFQNYMAEYSPHTVIEYHTRSNAGKSRT